MDTRASKASEGSTTLEGFPLNCLDSPAAPCREWFACAAGSVINETFLYAYAIKLQWVSDVPGETVRQTNRKSVSLLAQRQQWLEYVDFVLMHLQLLHPLNKGLCVNLGQNHKRSYAGPFHAMTNHHLCIRNIVLTDATANYSTYLIEKRFHQGQQQRPRVLTVCLRFTDKSQNILQFGSVVSPGLSTTSVLRQQNVKRHRSHCILFEEISEPSF